MPDWGRCAAEVMEGDPWIHAGFEHSKPAQRQAESLTQAAGIKNIVGPAVKISLCTSLWLPPEISAILYVARYPEACCFEVVGCVAKLLLPEGPGSQFLADRPLRSAAGRWMETCRWVFHQGGRRNILESGKKR